MLPLHIYMEHHTGVMTLLQQLILDGKPSFLD